MNCIKDLPAYAEIPHEINKYTIRDLFCRYRDQGGECWVDSDPPEMSVTGKNGEISCMNLLDILVGTVSESLYIGPKPNIHESLMSMMIHVSDWVAVNVENGHVWCPRSVDRFTRSGDIWRNVTLQPLAPNISKVFCLASDLSLVPIAVSVIHSSMESLHDDIRNVYDGVYLCPRTTIPSTGLFGTSHNNSYVDMCPREKDKVPDVAKREFKDSYVGFICASHTSHSYEAGKSRRTAQDVRVRLMGPCTYESCLALSERQVIDESPSDWTVLCVGQICKVNYSTILEICTLHKLQSMSYDPEYGVHINVLNKLCIICISSGVLTKKCSNGVWADSCNTHISDRLNTSVNPIIDRSGPDLMRACFSQHYSLVPNVEYNAAVRTSISSAQIIQAICLPHCPATANISPVYVFKPIVCTNAYMEIMKLRDGTNELDLASYMPGENPCVLYHNMPLNYEDSIVVSKRYVELGGFSTMSTCKYLIPSGDYVPPVGCYLCAVLSKWWKSPCRRGCKHTVEYLVATSKHVQCNFGPTGKIVSKTTLKNGDNSIKVSSFSPYQVGDKLSTGHGQKGVGSVLVGMEDLPICISVKDPSVQIIPDVIMGVGSIVSRQTAGQIYESGAALERLADPSKDPVIQPDEIRSMGEEVYIINPRTGKYVTTAIIPTGSNVPTLSRTKATLGYPRVFNQSQTTRERHFTSHRSMTSNTLRTPVKRSRGGAVRMGEMEVQALVASGLRNCAAELRLRGDIVVVDVCASCQRLRLLHSCTNNTEFNEVSLPYDVIVLDCVNKIVHNISLVYKLEVDV